MPLTRGHPSPIIRVLDGATVVATKRATADSILVSSDACFSCILTNSQGNASVSVLRGGSQRGRASRLVFRFSEEVGTYG